MKPDVLKSLLGKYVSRNYRLAFCHVDRVTVIEGQKAIVSAFVKAFNNKLFHWFLEATWSTDQYGVHTIQTATVLREDDLSGESTVPRNPVQEDS